MTNRFARLRWYLDRLRTMTTAEVAFRARQATRKAVWARRLIGWPDAAVSDASFPEFAALKARLAEGATLGPVTESLAAIGLGQLRFLGREWPPTSFGDAGTAAAYWLHDPVSGSSWPGSERSAFGIDVRSTSDHPTDGRFGDVKFVWELNRLQILHPLAAAIANGDRSAGAAGIALLRSWACANPPYGGVNWTSGLEASLRLVSVFLFCVGAGESLSEDDRAFVRRFIIAHAEVLAAFPSRHSSANNHLVGEGLGLLLAGLLVPERGRSWTDEGRTILETEAARQILPDGVGAEQSPTYQAFTMELLAFGALVSHDAGRPLGPIVTDRLAAGATFLLALMDAQGRVPSIGDDDEGRVCAQPPDREPRYVASVVACVAALTARPDLMPPAIDPHLRHAAFGVTMRPAPAADGRQVFREGGYTTSRETIRRRQVHVVFDHGPLGYLSLAAHGHADALAIWLTVDGQPVLIDAGTYLYFSGGARRRIFREGAVHNTLCIEGQSQSVSAGGFNWASQANARLLSSGDGHSSTGSGDHDGYVKRFSVRHVREITWTDQGFHLTDHLDGAPDPLVCEIRFLLHPAIRIVDEPGAFVVANAQPLCRFLPPAGFATRAIRAEDGTLEYSPAFGTLVPAQGLVFTGRVGTRPATTHIEIIPPSV